MDLHRKLANGNYFYHLAIYIILRIFSTNKRSLESQIFLKRKQVKLYMYICTKTSTNTKNMSVM